jgi:hypothetical protein
LIFTQANFLGQGREGIEKVSEWIQKIQTLGPEFREAALLNCTEGATEGILDLSDKLRNEDCCLLGCSTV